jgi:hypothetical protein
MRSALFWDTTQCLVVVLYRRFGTNCRAHRKGSRNQLGPIGCPETSVQNYHFTVRNISEERRSDFIWVWWKGFVKTALNVLHRIGFLDLSTVDLPRITRLIKQVVVPSLYTYGE